MPSAVFDVASITPETGFTIKPVRPLKPPLRKPPRPYFYAPFTGYFTSPVMPVNRPFAMLLPPLRRP